MTNFDNCYLAHDRMTDQTKNPAWSWQTSEGDKCAEHEQDGRTFYEHFQN